MMKNTPQQSMMSSQTGGQNRMGMMNPMGVHSRSPLGNPGMDGQGNMLPPQHAGMVSPGQQQTAMPGGNHMTYPGPHHMMGQEQQHLQQPPHGMNPNMMSSAHHGNMMPLRGPVAMETLPPAANQNGTVMTSSGGRPMPMRGGGMDSSPTGYHSSASLVSGHNAPPGPHGLPPSPTSGQMQASHGYPGLTPAQGRQYSPQNQMRQGESHDHPYHRQAHQQTPPPQTHRGPFPDPPKITNPATASDVRLQQHSRPVSDMGNNQGAATDSKPAGQSKQLVTGIPKSPTVTLPEPKMVALLKSNIIQGRPLPGEEGAGASKDTSTEQEESVATNLPESTLANTKEKTPMCLINELSRYNKAQHQYMLVDEQGPAHKKTFFVKLKLGTEEYSSNGQSIKKAQHAAAEIALEKTMYKHPPPRPARSSSQNGWNKDNRITPTMELNALAAKRDEQTEYKLIRQPRFQPMYMQQRFEYPQEYPRGSYNQRYQYRRMPWTYISLKVGIREFIGEGPTPQMARHNAAEKALRILNRLPMPAKPVGEAEKEKSKDGDAEADDESDETEDGKTKNGDKLDDELKSEISLVYEIAVREKLHVVFEVIAEAGPPHLKTFTTRCIVGKINSQDSTFNPQITINSDGSSKKISKKKAALEMFEALKKKYQSIPSAVVKPKMVKSKKKNRNLIKVQKAEVNYGSGINPISRLIQIMQAQKKKDPVYMLIEEKAMLRRREFVMEVRVDDNHCTGSGPNKKLAKRSAAEAMLKMLGYSKPLPQPSKPALKSTVALDTIQDKKVTFVESTQTNTSVSTDGGKMGRQIMPGLLLLNDAAQAQSAGIVTSASGGGGSGDGSFANGLPTPQQQQQQTKGASKEAQSPLSHMGSGDGPQQKASSARTSGNKYSSLKADNK